MGAKATVRTVSPEDLVNHYLPTDYKFGSDGATSLRGNRNYEVPSLPAMKLTATNKVTCEIPEGASMFIYKAYTKTQTGKVIAVIFFPANDGQVKIMAGGHIIVRRF